MQHAVWLQISSAVTQTTVGLSPTSCAVLLPTTIYEPQAPYLTAAFATQPWMKRWTCFHIQSAFAVLCDHTHTQSSAPGYVTTLPFKISSSQAQHCTSPSRDSGSLNCTGASCGENTCTNSISNSHMASPAQLEPLWPARANAPWPQGFRWHQGPSSPMHPSSLMRSFFSPPISSTHDKQICPGLQASRSLQPCSDGRRHAGLGTLPSNRPSASNKLLFPRRQPNHLSLIVYLLFSQGVWK